MKKVSQIVQIGLFLLFLAVMPILYILLPDRANSESENRTLAQKPAFSWQALMSGDYTAGVDAWLTDQIPFRDGWIALRSMAERALLKTESNGAYLCGGQTLIARVAEPEEKRVQANCAALETLVQNAGVPVYLSLIPSAAAVWSDRLPAGAPTADEAAWIGRVYAGTAAHTVDTIGALSAHKDEEIYYRLDHHWTTRGAYYGAAALLQAMELPVPEPEKYTKSIVSEKFYGTTYSKAGVRGLQPDRIERWVPENGVQVTWYQSTTASEPGRLYAESFLDVKDKYSYFLGGNRARIVIGTGHEGPRLLLLRDSYSDCEVPFLLEAFSEIHLLDPRYYTGSVKQYIEQQQIDCVAVNMSWERFAAERTVALIGT